MPKRTNDFQRLVVLLERVLADSNTTVTESKELLDKIIGKTREVDIVIERIDSLRHVVLSIECTGGLSTRPATVEWVERMWGKHQSLPTSKLVLVSQTGFSSSAKKKADWLNIDAIDINETGAFKWRSLVTEAGEIQVSSFLLPYITDLVVVFPSELKDSVVVSELNLRESRLLDPEGNDVGSPLDVATKWLSAPEVISKLEEVAFTDASTVVEFERPLKLGCQLVDSRGKRWPVTGLHVKARCKKEVGTIRLEPGTYGNAQIAHGAGTTFGRTARVVLTQKQGEPVHIAMEIEKGRAQKQTPNQ